jgi:RNA polymerase sigma-70 factor, ECF subfamily
MASRPTAERDLLAAAGRGDEAAFERLVRSYRSELHAHCYRMLGSLHDAEDALQDAMLRAWRAIGRFERRSTVRSWLYKIATNTCLDVIARRPKRVLPIDYGPPADPHGGPGAPLVESVWVEPYPDEAMSLEDGFAAPEARYELRESVELAFVAALQHLPANQRAALILREVLGFSAKEVAETLDTSVASVNSALQRARATIDDKLPDQSQQATLRSLGDAELEKIVSDYIEALSGGDVERVVSLLAEDAAWSMPPLASWFRGLDDLRVFLRLGPMSGEWRWKRLPAHANGQVAVAAYTWREDEQCFRPFALDVLTLRGNKIAEVTAFITRSIEVSDPEAFKRWPNQPPDREKVGSVFERFGLPDRLD